MRTGPRVLTLPAAVHGGIDAGELLSLNLDPARILDFSANQSPLDVSPSVLTAVGRAVLDAYPDRDAREFAGAVAARHGLRPGQVVVGNGSTELIRLLAQIVLEPGDVALCLASSFGEYQTGTLLGRGRFAIHPLALAADGFAYDHEAFRADLDRLRPRLCWLCSPHNPTGVTIPAGSIEELVRLFPETVFVLDEAYVDLLPGPQWTAVTLELGNLVVLRSMTKAWGLAGLRLGYALAGEALAAPLRACKPPWNVNACAQAAGAAVLADTVHYREALVLLGNGREMLMTGLQADGWTVLPSAASFFLTEVGDAALVRKSLLQQGCLVRDCTSFGLPGHVRVSPRLPEQNERLLEAFATLSAESRA
jgi:histidinol-phosphate aminotransferase